MRLRVGLLLAVGIMLSMTVTMTAFAQEDTTATCQALVSRAIEELTERCTDMRRGTACYGSGTVEATFFGTAAPVTFNKPGDRAPLSDMHTIRTAPLDLETGTIGAAMLKLDLDVPASLPGVGAIIIMLGDVAIENGVLPQEALKLDTFVVATSLTNANVREGAGTNNPIIGSVPVGTALVADGLSADGGWVRVINNALPGWVSRELLTAQEGLIETLPKLDKLTAMQSIYLDIGFGAEACGEAVTSLYYFKSPPGMETHMFLNDMGLAMRSEKFCELIRINGSPSKECKVQGGSFQITLKTGQGFLADDSMAFTVSNNPKKSDDPPVNVTVSSKNTGQATQQVINQLNKALEQTSNPGLPAITVNDVPPPSPPPTQTTSAQPARPKPKPKPKPAAEEEKKDPVAASAPTCSSVIILSPANPAFFAFNEVINFNWTGEPDGVTRREIHIFQADGTLLRAFPSQPGGLSLVMWDFKDFPGAGTYLWRLVLFDSDDKRLCEGEVRWMHVEGTIIPPEPCGGNIYIVVLLGSPYVGYFDRLVLDFNYFGTICHEIIYGNNFNNIIYGDGGNDIIYGFGGDDILYGGEGNDLIFGGTGSDIIDGGPGRDILFGGNDNSFFRFGHDIGNDLVMDSGGDDGDVLYGGNFNAYGGFGHDGSDVIIDFGGNRDILVGGNWNSVGGVGSDNMDGGRDLIIAVGDNDIVVGGNNNTFFGAGNDGRDVIVTVGNSTQIIGGNDNSIGGVGDDASDAIFAIGNNSVIIGGNDNSFGGIGNDNMDGGGDAIYTNDGDNNDLIISDNLNTPGGAGGGAGPLDGGLVDPGDVVIVGSA